MNQKAQVRRATREENVKLRDRVMGKEKEMPQVKL